MIISCTIVFNEEKMLPGCLESIRGKVDRMIIVDGAYTLFPHEVPWSTDATLDIAWCYGAEIIECPRDAEGNRRAWHTQVEKRSAYFVGEGGDWYFHIDADERLVGELPEPRDGEHYAFRILNRHGRATRTPRLWQHRGFMRYEGSHNAVWSDNELVHLKGATPVPTDRARFLHLSHLRSAQRIRDKRIYYPEKNKLERPYRKAHSI